MPSIEERVFLGRGPAKVIKCKNWDDFVSRVRIEEASQPALRWLYRGQRDPNWRLASQVERRLELLDFPSIGSVERVPALEEFLSMDFRDGAELRGPVRKFKHLAAGTRGLRSVELKNPYDWLALGRHHGLETPLLDWSESPFVAAFFAFADILELGFTPDPEASGQFSLVPGQAVSGNWDDELVAVWGLLQSPEDLIEAGNFEVVDRAFDFGHRQRAQRGLFTRLTHRKYFDLESYLVSLNLAGLLRKYLVPFNPAVFAELERMNIAFATLFPDLVGAALQANFHQFLFAFKGLEGFDDEA